MSKKNRPAADAPRKTAEVRAQSGAQWAAEKSAPRWLMAAAAMRTRLESGADLAALEITEAAFDAALDAAR